MKCLGVDFGIEHKNGATGLRASCKKHQLEIWSLPAGTIIPPHKHEHIDSFIMAIWGRQRWTIQEKVCVVLGPVRKRLSNSHLAVAAKNVPRQMRHGVTAIGYSMFLNLERTTRGVSAAVDFIEVP